MTRLLEAVRCRHQGVLGDEGAAAHEFEAPSFAFPQDLAKEGSINIFGESIKTKYCVAATKSSPAPARAPWQPGGPAGRLPPSPAARSCTTALSPPPQGSTGRTPLTQERHLRVGRRTRATGAGSERKRTRHRDRYVLTTYFINLKLFEYAKFSCPLLSRACNSRINRRILTKTSP